VAVAELLVASGPSQTGPFVSPKKASPRKAQLPAQSAAALLSKVAIAPLSSLSSWHRVEFLPCVVAAAMRPCSARR
jgi:hypothetical protein